MTRASALGRVTTLAVLLGVVAAAPARARDAADDQALEERVDQLEELLQRQNDEIEDLQNEIDGEVMESEIPTDEASLNPSRSWMSGLAYGIRDIELAIHGFLNLEFTAAQKDGANDGKATFDLHHANLFFDALLNPRLRTHVEIELEHATEIEVDQAFVEWGPFDWLTLTGGRFYAPFGIERFTWYPPVNLLVSRPLPFREIIPGNFYQTGLMASGYLATPGKMRFTYELSVSNGLGEDAVSDRRGSRQPIDNNDPVAVTTRLATILWPWMEFGTSVHFQQFQSSGERQELLFLGGDLSGRWRGFVLRGEYVWAVLDRVATTDLRQNGLYTQLSYTHEFESRILNSVSPVIRYDWVDLDRSVTGNDDVQRWSFGLNLEIFAHFRFKTEYQLRTEKGPKLDDNAFLFAVVADF